MSFYNSNIDFNRLPNRTNSNNSNVGAIKPDDDDGDGNLQDDAVQSIGEPETQIHMKSFNTNKLRNRLENQKQQIFKDNGANGNSGTVFADGKNNNLDEVTANFHSITEYVLQYYFKVITMSNLSQLKLIDLIVDQTFSNSLTLRKLNENDPSLPYCYFNTVTRDQNISKCPVFAISTYFVIRWSNPSLSDFITLENFHDMLILKPNLISMSNIDINSINDFDSNFLSSSENTTILKRDEEFKPSPELIYVVFPWLKNFKTDFLTVDKTNYKLSSLIELFEFIGKVILQDLRILVMNNNEENNKELLPNIFSLFQSLVPKIFENEEFQYSLTKVSDSSKNKQAFPGDDGDDAESAVSSQMESSFLSLSERLNAENIRLTQQIRVLKLELKNVNSICKQILQTQKQMVQQQNFNNVPYMNDVPPDNNYGYNFGRQSPALNSQYVANPISANNNGLIILDKNTINTETINSLVRYLETGQQDVVGNKETNNISSISGVNNGGMGSRDQHQQSHAIDRANSDTRSTSYYSSSHNVPNQHKYNDYGRGMSNLSTIGSNVNNNNNGMSYNQLQRMSNYQYNNQDNENGAGSQRRLPLPYSQTDSLYSPPLTSDLNMDGSYLSPSIRRLRPDDKNTPSQTALDSLLSVSISTPKTTNATTNSADAAAVSKADFNSSYTRMINPLLKSAPKEYLQNSVNGYSVANNNPNQSQRAPASDSIDLMTISKKSNTYANTESSNPNQSPSINYIPSNSIEEEGISGESGNDSHNKVMKKSTEDRKFERKPMKHKANEAIKYKLSRENKSVWDLYTEWYIGLNGGPSIAHLIKNYGYRRWKVPRDSHFFPTRKVIMDYIESECDRSIQLGRFKNKNQPREELRKILVGDLEKFRINNGLTLNSLSLFFKKLRKDELPICIFRDFETWEIKQMTDFEKNKYCKRQHGPHQLLEEQLS